MAGSRVSDSERQLSRFLALGDSYTIGEGVAQAFSWPQRVASLLRDGGFPLEEVQIIARTGWTTAELLNAVDASKPLGPFSLVTVQIGVNNQYRGEDAGEFRSGFERVLGRAIDLADGSARRVIVISIPDWGVTPFAAGRDRATIAREIDRYNEVVREEAGRAGARHVDVTLPSRTAGSDPRRMLAGDELHPSPLVYEQWARLIAPIAREILETGIPRV